MNHARCTGWWAQEGLGRQEMEGLMMAIEGDQIEGSGYDVIGMFTFSGILNDSNEVLMTKQYMEKHAVVYRGYYNGSDRLWGLWQVGGWAGPWEIQFREGKEREKRTARFSEKAGD